MTHERPRARRDRSAAETDEKPPSETLPAMETDDDLRPMPAGGKPLATGAREPLLAPQLGALHPQRRCLRGGATGGHQMTTTTDPALDTLVGLHAALHRAEQEAKALRAERNGAIRQLRDQGMSVNVMAEALGLSRKAVYLVLEQDR